MKKLDSISLIQFQEQLGFRILYFLQIIQFDIWKYHFRPFGKNSLPSCIVATKLLQNLKSALVAYVKVRAASPSIKSYNLFEADLNFLVGAVLKGPII